MKVVYPVAIIALLAVSGYLLCDNAVMSIKASFADDQTQIFEEMAHRAVEGDTSAARECLRYVTWYYPSGTKQSKGSKLDRVVERCRAFAVREIIAQLRKKTGKDYGDDPEKWLSELP